MYICREGGVCLGCNCDIWGGVGVDLAVRFSCRGKCVVSGWCFGLETALDGCIDWLCDGAGWAVRRLAGAVVPGRIHTCM